MPAGDAPTLGVFAATWLREITVSRSRGTCDAYESLLRLHILPLIGHIRLDALRTRDVQAMLVALRAKPRPDGRPCRSTPRQALACLSALMSSAVRKEYAPRNPCDGAGADVLERRPAPPDRSLNDDEQAALLAAAAATCPVWVNVAIFVGLRTGVRPGELLALERADVDLERRVLRVDDTRSDRGMTGTTKGRAPRFVDLASDAAALLAWHMGTVERWLFESTSEPGRPWTQRTFARWFARAAAHAGIAATPHASRHSFCTGLAREGVDPLYIQRAAGHRSLRTTERYFVGAARRDPQLVERLRSLIPVG